MSVQKWNDDEYFLTTRPGPELNLELWTEERLKKERRAEKVYQAVAYDAAAWRRYWDD